MRISDSLGLKSSRHGIVHCAAGQCSSLFIVIPLYVARLPAPWFPWPESVRAAVLISIYGLVNALLQPFSGALSDRIMMVPFLCVPAVLAQVPAAEQKGSTPTTRKSPRHHVAVEPPSCLFKQMRASPPFPALGCVKGNAPACGPRRFAIFAPLLLPSTLLILSLAVGA